MRARAASISDCCSKWRNSRISVTWVAICSTRSSILSSRNLELRYESSGIDRVSLHLDGTEVAEAPLHGLMLFTALIPSGGGMLVGRDRGIAMSDDYTPPFAFTGTIRRMVMASADPDAADPAAEAEIEARSD